MMSAQARIVAIITAIVAAAVFVLVAIVGFGRGRVGAAAGNGGGGNGGGGNGGGGNGGGGNGGGEGEGEGGASALIPVGPITQAERDACEVVLALDPQPEQYADDQGRLWTPCVSWWVGEKIPDWPPGVWPGQVEYLRRPVDAADWLGCIAGYLVYKGPLKVAVEKNYPDEAATVEITKLLTARREVLRAHMIERLAALGRQNAVNDCGAVDVVLPACAVDPKWPKTEEAAAKAWLTIEVAARKRINQYKASRSIDPISGVPGDGWTAKAGPYWRWVLGQSLGPAFVLAKITSGPCVWESDEFSPMGKRLAVLADDVAATVGDAP